MSLTCVLIESKLFCCTLSMVENNRQKQNTGNGLSVVEKPNITLESLRTGYSDIMLILSSMFFTNPQIYYNDHNGFCTM